MLQSHAARMFCTPLSNSPSTIPGRYVFTTKPSNGYLNVSATLLTMASTTSDLIYTKTFLPSHCLPSFLTIMKSLSQHLQPIQPLDLSIRIGQVTPNTASQISGICLYFAGARVVYRSRFQSTISQSSTKPEFIAANDAGKLALYL